MTYADFYKSYLAIKEKNPSYRLGQHFVIMFIKDECSDPEVRSLWNAKDEKATAMIKNVIDKYQWDMNNMPVLKRVA